MGQSDRPHGSERPLAPTYLSVLMDQSDYNLEDFFFFKFNVCDLYCLLLTRTDLGQYRTKITDILHEVLSTMYVYVLSP